MLSGLFFLNTLGQPISSLRGVWSVLIITMFCYMPVINANSVDPDQMPHLWNAVHKWVNLSQKYFALKNNNFSPKQFDLDSTRSSLIRTCSLELHGRFSAILYKGHNFCDFLFAFLHT